jgi:hypothetical protein
MPKPSTSAPAETADPATQTALAPIQATTALSLVRDVLETIPQADEDPTERMAAFIMGHAPEEWETLWAGIDSVKDHVGEQITVHAMRARESDFEGPLGLYLILDVTLRATGEKTLISCSSQMSMVQLLALYRAGRLPATVEIVQKEKPTKAGFKPIHLRYIGAQSAALGDPGAVVSEQ